ncbi:coenzyme F420-0:L-glutamate ligase [Candidatus Bathyarchaeota archaeon]|nr:coenzyme F420-0:L-glutamate ligase [Candidatus Bathyarchaeota archaeon]
MITLIGLEGIPVIKAGDDLGEIIVKAAERQGIGIRDGDVVVVTQKVVSKAEGRLINLEEVRPSSFAEEVAKSSGKDPKHVEVILRETRRIVKMRGHVLVMETRHGFVCANAGVDLSNVGGGQASLLPEDPDESAKRIRRRIIELTGREVAVIITDTWGRPWRLGQVDFAIGVTGMKPLRDYRGERDPFGYELTATNIAVADELAAAAELAKGKLSGIPVVIIRGYEYPKGDGRATDMNRPIEEDLFR